MAKKRRAVRRDEEEVGEGEHHESSDGSEGEGDGDEPMKPAPAHQEADTEAAGKPADGRRGFRPKESPLVLCSRGIPARPHHLMFDFIRLLPHCKRDAKLDTKNDVRVVNEAAELKNATSCVLFEARKRQDLYIWLGKTPGGPTVKCHAANIHTMGELKLTGNHLKGSRPLLNFSEEFDASPHFALVKEILTHVFSLPKGHKHSKPFYDHVLNFTLLDGRVWIRNYQIAIPSETKAAAEIDSASLTEVGPRACLQPIKVFAGAFSGAVLWENESYVSPNVVRAQKRREKGQQYNAKVGKKVRRKQHLEKHKPQPDELKQMFKF